MKKPFSKEELAALRELDLRQFASLPILYDREINNIFNETIPRLLDVAEDHASICESIQNQKANAVQVPYSENKVIVLKSLLSHEERHLEIVAKTIEIMQKQYDKKKELLAEVQLMINPPWYTRLFQWIKEKARKVLP